MGLSRSTEKGLLTTYGVWIPVSAWEVKMNMLSSMGLEVGKIQRLRPLGTFSIRSSSPSRILLARIRNGAIDFFGVFSEAIRRVCIFEGAFLDDYRSYVGMAP